MNLNHVLAPKTWMILAGALFGTLAALAANWGNPLVKGKTDYVASEGKILATISEPDVPTLEPIGGTGDTITGLVSALVYAGLEPKAAAIIACRANRMAGKLTQPTPATKVRQVVDQFPTVLRQYYQQWTQTLAA
ncbi:MAG TPA: NAD(P)H-hydrate dehydratase [Stenomitos sp.]